VGHWSRFLRAGNFQLAFDRLIRAGNKDYKLFSRHLVQAYGLAKDANLRELVDDVRRGRYEPDEPIRIFQPKSSGVLRPLTLLTLRDQIVYQAIGNVIAEAFEARQQRYAYKRRFGAIFGGTTSPFFFGSWKRSYAAYNAAVANGRPSIIEKITRFKYALWRLRPRRDVLRRIGPLLIARPDLAGVLARYVARFGPDREAAGLLANALRQHPVFDAAAASFVDALDVCESPRGKTKCRRAVRFAMRQSVERGGVLRVAVGSFFAKRSSGPQATALIDKERVPLFRSLLLNKICDHPLAPFGADVCAQVLQDGFDSPLSSPFSPKG